MKGLHTFEDLMHHELSDLYSAERQLVKALPKVIKAAQSSKLQAALKKHLKETEGHIARLERAFSLLSMKPGRKTCEGMRGLIDEGSEIVGEEGAPDVIDAAIIAQAQRMEHYEIAGYGCVQAFAKIMGEEEVSRLMQQSLDEEHEADKALTTLAMQTINHQAARQSDEDEEESSKDFDPDEAYGVSKGNSKRRKKARRNT